MIDIVCACGAKGPVPDQFAGKRVKCPKCEARIDVPAPALAATSAASAPADSGAYDIAPGPAPVAAAPDAQRVPISAAGNLRRLAPPGVSAPDLLAAPSRAPLVSATRSRHEQELAARRERGFARDLLDAGVFIASPRGVGMFLALGCVGAVGEIPSFWARLFSAGVLSAYFFAVVVEAAGGERGLPGFSQWEGLMESVVGPAAKFFGVGIVLGLPALAAYFLLPMAGAPDDAAIIGAMVLAVAAALLWPVAILIVALGDFASIIRVDMLVRTAIAAPLAYLVVLVMVGASFGLQGFASDAIAAAMAPEDGDAEGASTLGFGGQVLVQIISLYCSLVAMQAIGLYYRHYSDRFPWDAG